MKMIVHDQEKYFLRFDTGEEVLDGLKNFCEKEKIKAGSWNSFGAAAEIILSYYDLKTRQYQDQNFQEMEIISVTGSISTMEKKIMLHAHGCFSGPGMQAVAGHIKKLVVSATCEVCLTVLQGKIERKFDEKTGLNLIIAP